MRGQILTSLVIVLWALYFIWRASAEGRHFYRSPFYAAAMAMLLLVGVLWGA